MIECVWRFLPRAFSSSMVHTSTPPNPATRRARGHTRPRPRPDPGNVRSRRPSRVPPAVPAPRASATTKLAVCGLLLTAVGLIFGQTVSHQFLSFDDNLYIYQ